MVEIRACCADASSDEPAPLLPPLDLLADDEHAVDLDDPVGPLSSITVPAEAPAADVSLQAPPEFGRSLVVRPGQEVPERWRDVPRILVDQVSGPMVEPLVDRLHDMWSTRVPYVVELAADLAEISEEADDREPWSLDASFSFPGERLALLVWSNAVDLCDPERPAFAPLTAAMRAGGRPGPTTDVVDRDGTALWCDGGPLDIRLANTVPVVHAVVLDHHRLHPLSDRKPTCDLAPDQLAAVRYRGGPCRVISPAGSGKTRTLTERARHVLTDWGLPPAAVCLVAYNRRAADEMRERLPDLAGLQIRTLNSLALAIVVGTGPFGDPDEPRPSVSTIDEGQVRAILDALVDLPRRANTDPAALWIEALARIRLGLRDPADVEVDYGGDLEGLGSIFTGFQGELAKQGVVDFDQQIYGAVTVLLRDPSARRRAQRACALLLVDEFQDLTPAHLLLVRLLAAPRYDVFGVGDDDQTIYGYNGADPRWLIDVERFFPGARSHPLTINYRCPPAVVRAADNLLSHNRRRVAKQIDSRPGAEDDGRALRVQATDETVGVTVSVISELLAAGASPDDVVVLTRVNSSLAPVQVALGVAGVPVERVSGPEWLRRTGVRAALAWLTLAARPDRLSAAALREASRRPSRGLSRVVGGWIAEQRSVQDVRALAGRLKKDRDRDRVDAFADDVEVIGRVGAKGATAALTHVRDDVGLGTAVNTLDTSRNWTNRASHGDDLDALIQLASLHDDIGTFAAWLGDRLADPADSTPRVQLHTVHRAKGLEWPHVIVHEASSRLFPHRLADDREEERRIFHVAITRCSESVTVVSPADGPTPFLAELAEKVDLADLADLAEDEPASEPASQKDPARIRDPRPVGQLEEALRAWRREQAHQRDVPAYVIFPDRTLDDLVERLPTTLRELGACHGIGPAKLEGFGEELLAIISGRSATGEVAATVPNAPHDASATSQATAVGTAPDGLAERLRSWRVERARELDVPAYRVFSNRTLDDLCARLPTTDEELLACSGIGPVKFEQCGDELLAIVADAVGRERAI